MTLLTAYLFMTARNTPGKAIVVNHTPNQLAVHSDNDSPMKGEKQSSPPCSA
ncbi:hypothetical protein [Polaromonas sp.]|uniref:hypothetical protein n=1 Tax=Polaromonas sp. TaxID=1869339 RepID=UPI0018226365|nr:hypothetical protein [Polaromonas sp.]NMM05481.1 hypothetical protein [Polaromonas sp.]